MHAAIALMTRQKKHAGKDRRSAGGGPGPSVARLIGGGTEGRWLAPHREGSLGSHFEWCERAAAVRQRGSIHPVSEINWSVLQPQEFEDTVAVLICAVEHRDAFQYRPGRGDRGIDVKVPVDRAAGGQFDVYQVKHFPGSLTSGRRNKVVESLQRAVDQFGERIRTWHLVVPINPTPGDDEWFSRTLSPMAPFPCRWRPLNYIRGLVAQKPALVDYHLHGDRRQLEARLAAAQSLFELGQQSTSGIASVGSFAGQMAAVLRDISNDDEHFEYQVEIGPHQPPPTDPRKYGFAGQSIHFDGEQYVSITAYARFADAFRSRGLPIEGAKIAFRCKTSNDQGVADFLDFGTGVTVSVDDLAEFDVRVPPMLGFSFDLTPSAQLTIAPMPVADEFPHRFVKLESSPRDETDGEPIRTTYGQIDSVAPGRRGGSLSGRTLDGMIEFTIRMERPPQTGGGMTFSTLSAAGKPISSIIGSIRFARSLVDGRVLTLADISGSKPLTKMAILTGVPREDNDQWLTLLEDLATIDVRSTARLVVPESYTKAEAEQVALAAQLLREERVTINRPTITLTLIPEGRDVFEELLTHPGSFVVDDDLIIRVGGRRVNLGRRRTVLPSATIKGVPQTNDDGSVTVSLTVGEPETAIVTLAPPEPSA